MIVRFWIKGGAIDESIEKTFPDGTRESDIEFELLDWKDQFPKHYSVAHYGWDEVPNETGVIDL